MKFVLIMAAVVAFCWLWFTYPYSDIWFLFTLLYAVLIIGLSRWEGNYTIGACLVSAMIGIGWFGVWLMLDDHSMNTLHTWGMLVSLATAVMAWIVSRVKILPATPDYRAVVFDQENPCDPRNRAWF